MQAQLGTRLIDMAERSIDYHDRMFDTIERLESNSLTRIVWFVAISGFALINAPSISTTFGDASICSTASVAWIVTSLFAILTHWQFRNKSVHNLRLYMAKREATMAYIANGPEQATFADLEAILKHESGNLPELLKSQVCVSRLSDTLEFLTLLSFVTSMFLTIRSLL